MSYLVLHMEKFKKEAVRGIQSHNRRERESHSNPDIDYQRSCGNYELHDKAATNYAQAIQRRIDDLQLIKAVRKDAVHMCGLIVTSDSAFFKSLSPEEFRRFGSAGRILYRAAGGSTRSEIRRNENGRFERTRSDDQRRESAEVYALRKVQRYLSVL